MGTSALNIIIFAHLMKDHYIGPENIETFKRFSTGILSINFTDEFRSELNTKFINHMMKCHLLIPHVRVLYPELDFFKNLNENLIVCFVKIMTYYPLDCIMSKEYKNFLLEEIKKDHTILSKLKTL